jgi:hypothetical protein
MPGLERPTNTAARRYPESPAFRPGEVQDKQVVKVTCVPVRHNQANETLIRSVADERDAMDKLIAASKKLGASLTMRGDELVVIEKQGVLA